MTSSNVDLSYETLPLLANGGLVKAFNAHLAQASTDISIRGVPGPRRVIMQITFLPRVDKRSGNVLDQTDLLGECKYSQPPAGGLVTCGRIMRNAKGQVVYVFDPALAPDDDPGQTAMVFTLGEAN